MPKCDGVNLLITGFFYQYNYFLFGTSSRRPIAACGEEKMLWNAVNTRCYVSRSEPPFLSVSFPRGVFVSSIVQDTAHVHPGLRKLGWKISG